MFKRMLMILMAAVMLWTAAGAAAAEGLTSSRDFTLTLEDLKTLNGDDLRVYQENGKVTFVDGTCFPGPVANQEDAQAVVAAMTPLLTGGPAAQFEPWSVQKDPNGNIYYVFQQVQEDILVQGGAVKVITDRDGKMLGLTGSVISDLPDPETENNAAALTAEQAEELALAYAQEHLKGNPTLVENVTEKIILPIDREVDIEQDDIPSRYVWVVYTTNPSGSLSSGDLPYLAHYITLNGEYLYSLPTLIPGDQAGSAGYDASYVFQFMEPAEYTGYVDLSDGTEKEITVSVMRDTRTGMYYLGNIEHQIVVADCWEFLYNHGRVVLEYSPDNREWDQTSLLSLYQYCRAWDYYNAIGWKGGDGVNTPIIVLKDYCDEEHQPIDNAAYAGKFYGWQAFLSSSANDFSQCLDVCAHEFTHCVTGALMTYNSYTNDYGAINEAISDIQGNLCEMMLGDTEDTTWILGENSSNPVRSMSDPHRYHQPEYVWDVYYKAGVLEPTDVNDRGGVHTNSSLLNRIAWLLCTQGGMSLEDARVFWFTADCAMVPGSNYPQLRELLPWVMKICGLDTFREALSSAIAETRLGETEMPEALSENKALVTLTLPDNAVFSNGKWTLMLASVNTEKLKEKVAMLIGDAISGRWDRYPTQIRDLMAPKPQEETQQGRGFLDFLVDAAKVAGEHLAERDKDPEPAPAPKKTPELNEFLQWLQKEAQEVFYYDTGSAGQDGRSIRMISKPGITLPLLLYISNKPNTAILDSLKAVILLNGRWVDLSESLSALFKDPEEQNGEELLTELMKSGLFKEGMKILQQGEGLAGFRKALTLDTKGGGTYELPTEGLDQITLDTAITPPPPAPTEIVHKMSRPKE